MQARLDAILMMLTREHAPAVLNDPNARGSSAVLARRLAGYGVLVLSAEVDHLLDPFTVINEWMRLHMQFYAFLAEGLFPSYTAVQPRILDNGSPVFVGLFGAATPVIQVMAGYVVPYISYCQRRTLRTTEAELRGMMDIVLEELEAADLPRPRYTSLRGIGIALMQHMIGLPLRQFSLTAFDRPVADELPTEPIPSSQDTRPMAAIRDEMLYTPTNGTPRVGNTMPGVKPSTLPGTGPLNPQTVKPSTLPGTGPLNGQTAARGTGEVAAAKPTTLPQTGALNGAKAPPADAPRTLPQTGNLNPQSAEAALSDTARSRAITEEQYQGGGGGYKRRPPVPDLPDTD